MSVTLPISLRGWQPAMLAAVLGLGAPLSATAQKALWTNNAEVPAKAREFTAALKSYRAIAVDLPAVRAALLPAPAEQGAGARNSNVVITLPTPEGGTERFRVTQVPVMAPALADRFPEIKTYEAQGVDDPAAVARLDVSPNGFHVMVLGGNKGTYYVDPALRFGDAVHHLVYRKSAMNMRAVNFTCGTDPMDVPGVPVLSSGSRVRARQSNGTQMKVYRLALACTGEYAAFHGGTTALAMAAMVTSMNRVNGVYEREISCRMVLVPNTNLLIYLNAATDPYDNTNAAPQYPILGQNQTNVTNIIGANNYDIGHVFTTASGGVAGKPSLCVSGQKARGTTGINAPVGDGFDIDFVAHEMGHQFNCNHTFNNNVYGSCGNNNRSGSTAYEPGSGVTIMAYAGLCSPEDLDEHSIDIFHSVSFDEVLTHINGAGNCGTVTATNNHAPVPNAGANYSIPKGTPFSLTGSATDQDGDPMTYEWEEFDRDAATSTAIASPSGSQPIFRPFLPSVSPTRYFPRLADVISNTQTIGEMMPSYARTMNFRFIARDNRVGGGGVDYAASQVSVVATAGPFVVQQPNTSSVIWQAGAPAQVNWDVAGTTAAPISAANVDILLSLDGGLTYPVTLLTGTPNDGSQSITVPAATAGSTLARVMVRGSGNVFFDISNQNFTIEASSGPTFFLTSAATSTAVAACAGASATATVNVGQLQGFTGNVTLGSGTLPTGITVAYAPASVAAGAATTATISASTAATAGTYQLVLNGVSGGVTHSQTVAFTVLPSATQMAVALSPTGAARAPQRPRFTWNAVPDATSYQVQVSTSSTFATLAIDQTVTTTSLTPTTQLAANTTYYWRVRGINACAQAPYSTPLTFQTGTETCVTRATTQINRPIAAGGVGSSSINITDGSRVGQVRVKNLIITHTAINELEVSLTNPSGTTVVLIARNSCPAGTNFNLSLDDQATAALTCPANTGATVQPANPLAALAGGFGNGNWILRVNDNGSGTGTITGWSLELCSVADVPNAPISITAIILSPAGPAGENVEALWTPAASGTAATYYELQRSFNANTGFATIAANIPVSSGGIYDDKVTTSGRYYYRVRSCNALGCSEWTNEASVLENRVAAQEAGVSISPNPSTGLFQLVVDNAQRGAVSLRVTDALGRVVTQTELTKGSAALQHTVDLSRLAPGVYNLHLALPNGVVVQKLLKQ